MYELLNAIRGPEDVKKLSEKELSALAAEIREALFNRLTKMGGHCGPNFGIVETEIAMHYVFSSPKDKFVFDVSHQTYPHKMLTGRSAGYTDETRFREDSGYTNPEESEHDLFTVGHTSTSVSLATGLAKARDLLGGKENVIALIGDGSLSGGEALEGLSVAGSELRSNLIVVVNDNQQSISETHGGIYENLRKLRETGGQCPENFFRAWGLDYIYENNGNDIPSLIRLFRKVKDIDHPVVVHINTVKGKGFRLVEENREFWHWVPPFDRETGRILGGDGGRSYTSVAREYILDKAGKNEKLIVVTPNMPGCMALSPADRESLGKQFADVGIAEEQAVAMASGLARGGVKPLVVTNMTFIQRAYDQISHDVCLNGSDVTFLINHTSFASLTDSTHLGIFAFSFFTNIPGLTVLAPSSVGEMTGMLDWAIDGSRGPVAILMPGGETVEGGSFDGELRYSVLQKGEKVAVIALGDFLGKGRDLCRRVEETFGFRPTLVNPRVASLVDCGFLEEIGKDHSVVVTLEDGVLEGGFGQKIASRLGTSGVKVKNYGLGKEFYDRYDPDELLRSLGMDEDAMLADVGKLLK